MAYASWAATTSYAVGAIVRATTVQDFGLVFKCTIAGTSGASAPAWPTLIDSTTVVALTTLVLAAYTSGFDFLISRVVGWLVRF
jgi:hypothetical protein